MIGAKEISAPASVRACGRVAAERITPDSWSRWRQAPPQEGALGVFCLLYFDEKNFSCAFFSLSLMQIDTRQWPLP